MDDCPSRRSVLASAGALALAGLAGCSRSDPENSTTATPGSNTPDGTTPSATTTSETTTSPTTDDVAAVDWDEVATFRTWLTDHSTLPESNHRFDYQQVGLDRVVGSGRAGFLDLDSADVDGFLVQSANAIYLGSFDPSSLTDAVESSDAHELTGEYEGYVTAEATEGRTQVAFGDDAVLVGSELSAWIDARRGDRERLEEIDPVFTRLFRRLPDRGVVTAQYSPPPGGGIDLDEIRAWGHSMPSLDAAAGTWVYVLEPDAPDGSVAELEASLAESAFTEAVTDSTVDDQFVTFTATMALPD